MAMGSSSRGLVQAIANPSVFLSANDYRDASSKSQNPGSTISSKKKILVVAISPPPYGGQAMMVKSLLESRYRNIELYHVRMSFSDSMASVGKFQVKKIFHMVWVVWAAIIKRFQHRIDTLYYVPGGSSAVPVIRDIFILFFLRLVFRKVIFHFHAAGISTVVEELPFLLKLSAKWVYNNSSLSIFLSSRNPDNQYFSFRRSVILSNGIADDAKSYLPFHRPSEQVISILFVGVLQRSKGIMVLLEAVRMLKANGHTLRVTFVGEFVSPEFQQEVSLFCSSNQLEPVVQFPGVKTGHAKWQYFVEADIFCFPSFFESESFGNVVVEAMMFELPVVATDWRGIPDIVEHDQTGILTPTENSKALAAALQRLIHDLNLRLLFGKNGRKKYLAKYQLADFTRQMEAAFLSTIN